MSCTTDGTQKDRLQAGSGQFASEVQHYSQRASCNVAAAVHAIV